MAYVKHEITKEYGALESPNRDGLSMGGIGTEDCRGKASARSALLWVGQTGI